MEDRKTEKTNLENKKAVFFLIGTLLILTVTYASFSYKSYNNLSYNFEMQVDEEMMDLPPVINPPAPPPPPPAPAHEAVEPILKLVEDEVKTKDPKFEDKNINEIEVDDNQIGEAPAPFSDELEDIPLTYVSNMPSLPECADLKTNEERINCTNRLILATINKNFEIPDMARELGQFGTVWVTFIVDKAGNVTNVEILKGINEYLDKECLKNVKNLPKFKPGTSMDRPVSIKYNIPLQILPAK
jgi:protein TonB